jgi:hypothetical protein
MESEIPTRLRAADADRERFAAIVQAAGAEGRLTLEEMEGRLGRVYATKYTDELAALTADLPARPERSLRATRIPHPALRVHAAIVLVLAVLLIVRWAVSGVPYFWAGAPLFWLAMSLVVHARIRRVRRRRGSVVSY